jgi:HD-GYP domain-containing protein (c-di-GMP phosphodiesterase class II)
LHDGTPLTDTAGVIRIMKEKAGIQFDPRIVDVLAGILETEDA